MNENPELSVDDVCNYRINLLKTQVEGYSRNYNVCEAGVYNYFEYYYPVRKTIDLLRIELQELLPLIEELRIKYEEQLKAIDMGMIKLCNKFGFVGMIDGRNQNRRCLRIIKWFCF